MATLKMFGKSHNLIQFVCQSSSTCVFGLFKEKAAVICYLCGARTKMLNCVKCKVCYGFVSTQTHLSFT